MVPESVNESKAWVTIVVVPTTLSIALVTLGLRVFTRTVLIKQFGADDWAALVAGLFYFTVVFYNATLAAVKLTFLLQYYRVFAVPKMRRAIIVVLVIVGCWCLSQLLIAIMPCRPIEKYWTPTLPGTCIGNNPFWYINAAGNLATDVVIFVLPLPALGSLNLRKRLKIVLMGIFSLGFFTCAISVIRFLYLQQEEDASWENVATSSWSVGELSSALTCACLSTLRPVFTRIVPGMSSPHSGERIDESYGKQSDDPLRLRSGSNPNPAPAVAAGGSQDRLCDEIQLELIYGEPRGQELRPSEESGHRPRTPRDPEHGDEKD
ncbi:hypothetical protein DL765_005423 [Monosporascus sp. GIB2]|nr:hypothetical protein DL765_005423 [Monosporascus sp. GIB2]